MDSISVVNTSIKRFFNKHAFSVTALAGGLITSGWTLIRFFNSGPNFDQIGQQVLAHQWVHGITSGSVIGPTNYILKMLFIYMPMDLLPWAAQFKLVLMTILVNILTFVLLAYILKLLWQEFFPKITSLFYPPLVYLALISGSVYWISFTNSRNLEVVGGVALIYLYIKSWARPSNLNYAFLIILGSLLFFADPLQIYMSMLPVLIFLGSRWLLKRDKIQFKILAEILGCGLVSIIFAHLLIKFAADFWHVSFIATNKTINFSVSSVRSAAEQMARLYAGGFEGGRLREITDLAAAAVGVVCAAYYAWRRPAVRKVLGLVASVWITNLMVYMVSGQAQQSGTNRYLIMTVPMFVLAMSVVLQCLPRKKSIAYGVALLLLFNIFTLGTAFARTWNPRFSNNDHERAVIGYFDKHSYPYGYASIGTTLSSDYLSNWKVNVLPLGCDPDQVLKQTSLFFDKGAFDITKRSAGNSVVPIILDGNYIKINQAACGVPQIEKQLGHEQNSDQLSDGSQVLLYKVSQLHNLRQPTNY